MLRIISISVCCNQISDLYKMEFFSQLTGVSPLGVSPTPPTLKQQQKTKNFQLTDASPTF